MPSKLFTTSTPRKAALTVLMLALSILVTFLLMEAALHLLPGFLTEGARLRLTWQASGERWYVPHPYIGHLHLPETHVDARTGRPGVEEGRLRDRWGFRNPWPWPEQVDIIAVGDSLTYSQEVDDDQAWPAILARALPHSPILNLGLVGAAPQQYLRIYETFGIERAPRVLLVGLFLGNDLWDAQKFDRWWGSGGEGSFVEFGRDDALPGVRGWIERRMQHLRLLVLLKDLRQSYREGRFLGGKTVTLAGGGRVQLVPSLLAQMAGYGQSGQPAFALVLDTLERLHSLAARHQTHCLVLFLPSKEEVYLPLTGMETADLAAPFLPELQKRGIAYLDLGRHFRQHAAAGEQLFWEVDGHPNAQGYGLIAAVVLEHLRAHAK
ncbi:MAG: hypothetical protein ACREOH_19565 [Candidatus Entotheonellia bacterium]